VPSRCGDPGLRPNVDDIKETAEEDKMNANLNATIATERHDRLVTEAAEYRRSTFSRRGKVRRARGSVASFLKDVVAASL
jgi:hypothetical protein